MRSTPESAPSVILLTADLMMTSAVGGATHAAGLPLQTISSVNDLTGVPDCDLVMIDLDTPGLNIADAAAALTEPTRRRAIVYGPHVHTQRFDAARAAGFATVIARGEFAASVIRRVTEFASQEGNP